eukprot:GILK01013442.1.p1 GENE.GILK01013442.1~~GILK01013442.1.p1  ORF type:complete len:720 (-),score=57.79 GILK01013442.1:8-2125(-)
MSSTVPASSGLASIAAIDVVVIVLYFVLVAIFSLRRDSSESQKSAQGESKEAQYFLASRSMSWWAIGCSLFASNIGSEHFIGLAGSGAHVGICVGAGEWVSVFSLLLLCHIFGPFYLQSRVFTMPQYLEQRYSPACRTFFAILSMVGFVLVKISVALYAGGTLFKVLLGWDMMSSAIGLILATGMYTVIGGMRSVVYTEVLQTGVLIGGGLILMGMAFAAVGGMDGLYEKLPAAGLGHIFQPTSHPDFPWTGIVLGLPFMSIWYWCTDQVTVQRILTAKDLSNAKAGALMAACLKILPVFLIVFPGMIASTLYSLDQPNSAFPVLVAKLMPPGLLGLMVAAIMAALMSSLASTFNSASTIFTMDFWLRRRSADPSQNGRQATVVGRFATVAMTILGIFWMSLIENFSTQLYVYTHKIMSYFAPPIAVVFLAGVLWPRANAKGAIYTLYIGGSIGMARFLLELGLNSSGTAAVTGFLAWFAMSNFLHFCASLVLFCTFILVIVSLSDAPPPLSQVEGLTWRWHQRVHQHSDQSDLSRLVHSPRSDDVAAAFSMLPPTPSCHRSQAQHHELTDMEPALASASQVNLEHSDSSYFRYAKSDSIVTIALTELDGDSYDGVSPAANDSQHGSTPPAEQCHTPSFSARRPSVDNSSAPFGEPEVPNETSGMPQEDSQEPQAELFVDRWQQRHRTITVALVLTMIFLFSYFA